MYIIIYIITGKEMKRQAFVSSTQKFVTCTCFDDDTSILLQIFCLINHFLCLLTFPSSDSNKRIISLIEVCTYQTGFSLPILLLGVSFLLLSSSTRRIVSCRFEIY